MITETDEEVAKYRAEFREKVEMSIALGETKKDRRPMYIFFYDLVSGDPIRPKAFTIRSKKDAIEAIERGDILGMQYGYHNECALIKMTHLKGKMYGVIFDALVRTKRGGWKWMPFEKAHAIVDQYKKLKRLWHRNRGVQGQLGTGKFVYTY